ncbi:MAG: phosphatase PAP2 family protein [Alphaproteobacteria bacterium]
MRIILWFMVISFGLTVGLNFFPRLDIGISNIFFLAPTQFILTDHPGAEVFRTLMSVIIWGLGIGLAIILVLNITKGRRFLGLDKRQIIFIYLCFLIGPGLVVNLMLKEHWGRARPSHIVELGGNKTFSPVFTPSVACTTNCSFASGEAALGFGFVSFGLLRPKPYKRAIFLGLGMGILISLIRLMAGGHFLSDISFSAGITLFFMMILYSLLIARRPSLT